MIAQDWTGKKFLFDLRVGYVKATEADEWLFEFAEKYEGHLRCTYLEAQGAFKIKASYLRREEARLNEERYHNRQSPVYLHLQPAPAVHDKDVRIRNALDADLAHSNWYVVESFWDEVNTEMRAFPQSSKKDILDMLALASSKLRLPGVPDEELDEEYYEDFDEEPVYGHNQAGY